MIGRRNKPAHPSDCRSTLTDPSLVPREIEANSTEDGRYQAVWSKNRLPRWRRVSQRRERIPDGRVGEYVREKLTLGRSRKQTAGRIRMHMPGKRISYETIYLYVFKVERSLTRCLTCAREHSRKRK